MKFKMRICRVSVLFVISLLAVTLVFQSCGTTADPTPIKVSVTPLPSGATNAGVGSSGGGNGNNGGSTTGGNTGGDTTGGNTGGSGGNTDGSTGGSTGGTTGGDNGGNSGGTTGGNTGGSTGSGSNITINQNGNGGVAIGALGSIVFTLKGQTYTITNNFPNTMVSAVSASGMTTVMGIPLTTAKGPAITITATSPVGIGIYKSDLVEVVLPDGTTYASIISDDALINFNSYTPRSDFSIITKGTFDFILRNADDYSDAVRVSGSFNL